MTTIIIYLKVDLVEKSASPIFQPSQNFQDQRILAPLQQDYAKIIINLFFVVLCSASRTKSQGHAK
jgi:hypothetical protein